MTARNALMAACALAMVLTGCEPSVEDYIRPDEIKDFKTIFAENCSGCHGVDGKSSAAQPLNDPLFQQLIPKEQLRNTIANGVPGTAMSGFSKAAGGFLTDRQIGILTDTMQQNWRGQTQITDMPPYSMPQGSDAGDAERGRAAFGMYCGNCHGLDGTGTKKAGSVVDPNYLALVSNQSLRTTTIVGRPGIQPDWRSYVPGHPMSAQEVTDVVAWIASHRLQPNGTQARLQSQPKENQ